MRTPLANVTLEMSLKPFRSVSDDAVEAVCRTAFEQWRPLIRWAKQVSVLLWTADGSEILTYDGNLDREIEWARYIGAANPKWEVPGDPEKRSIHARPYLYNENPARITYRDLRRIIAAIKRVGAAVTGLPVRVGETFDPGTEFAKSRFKYELHNEICLANTGGPKSFACCYATLNADHERYAGFPEGIPQDTPLGTFLGRQCQHMLSDLGFDYIWLSNGFGFGLETWMTRGPMFDGVAFDGSKAVEIREKILNFWRTFRAECPDIPIETRGTNLGTGIDLSSDAVPLRDIYDGNFKMQPPPNSPWAALNGDFGLELAGYMSHIAELPNDRGFPFRFYTHDPWWHNSPWLDRYGREPHDIYMPLSVSRIDGTGKVETPSSVLLLTIDDSHGLMPEQVPNEVIPHLHEALRRSPDAPGPLVWVYPFDEYHEMTFGPEKRLEECFFGDWFIRSSIMNGLPLNTVISTRNYLRTLGGGACRGRIIVTPVPDSGTTLSDALIAHVTRGGRALLYGPTGRADQRMLTLLGLSPAPPIEGELHLSLDGSIDHLTLGVYPSVTLHRALMSGGGYDATATQGSVAFATVSDLANQHRAAATHRADPTWDGGAVAWVRGTSSYAFTGGDLISGRGHLPTGDDPTTHFHGDVLMRFALARLGWSFGFAKRSSGQRNPVTCVSRHDNGFFFSGYVPDTTVEMRLATPHGAPVFVGCDAEVSGGEARYRMPRAWRRECRVFVEQSGGVVTCHEKTAEMIGLRRRLLITGLADATIRFFPEAESRNLSMVLNGRYPFFEGPFVAPDRVDAADGKNLVARGLSGELLIGW